MVQRIGRCLLRQRLMEARLRQIDLSIKIGLSPSYISDLVNNRSIMTLETARNISLVIGCSIEELYEWSEIH